MLTDEEAQAHSMNCARSRNLVEAGWVMAMLRGKLGDLPETDLTIMRAMFYAGAKHLLDLMLAAQRREGLDPQRVVNDLQAELGRFGEELRPKDLN
jgi:hypothetical protein